VTAAGSARDPVRVNDHEMARTWATRLGRIGTWSFELERLGAAQARGYVRELETLGIAALWIPEALGSKEVFAHAGLLLAASERLVIATGIANIWARDATAMANGHRALAEAYPRRFLLGLGVSHAPAVKMRGASYAKPVASMARYLDAMDKAPFTGAAPAETPARVLAALGPRMLRLAGERSIGAHPYFVPVTHTTIARKELGHGPLLAVEQAAVLSTDPAVARATARRHMKRYLSLDNYANNLRRLGWTDADLANDGNDALVDEIVAWGDVQAIRRRVDVHLANGADHVCVQLLRVDPKGDPLAEWRQLAPALS
jgi:probable F420-dependent oxidoreductase